MKDFEEFVKNFNLVDNALQMRTLKRWNGRDLRESENLSEHTHLTMCCLYDIIENLPFTEIPIQYRLSNIIKNVLCHDSLELLRGDILSVTKNIIPGLREFTDNEEAVFMNAVCPTMTKTEEELLRLADLMACYKFVEWELRYPSNEFAKNAYIDTKTLFEKEYAKFISNYKSICQTNDDIIERFSKGYAEDAGVDIILDRDVTFMPMSTTNIELNVHIVPNKDTMSFLCARTSAAAKGLSVATCPIDPNYCGNVSAIVHNLSNNIVTYKAGEAFCQYVTTRIECNTNIAPRKPGKRTDSKLGGTGNVNNS